MQNEEKQFIMSIAREMREQGHSFQFIADKLNALGKVTRKGGRWTRQALNKHLRRSEERDS